MSEIISDSNTVTQANGLDLRAIHPRNGAKYSPNLYKWLTKRRYIHRAWTSHVYRSADGVLWIGRLDESGISGAKLYAVLCNGASEETAFWVNLRGLVEITDFWPNYVRDGRCAIDSDHTRHFISDESRWRTIGDQRACNWCGRATQVLTRWTETLQREAWKNSQAAIAATSSEVAA